MNIFRNRAIKRYARELPRRLASDYGASKFYTPNQIERAAINLKLDPSYIIYGHAMFLNEAEFAALNPSRTASYHDLRREGLRHIPSVVTSKIDPLTDSNLGTSNIGGGWGIIGPGGLGDNGNSGF